MPKFPVKKFSRLEFDGNKSFLNKPKNTDESLKDIDEEEYLENKNIKRKFTVAAIGLLIFSSAICLSMLILPIAINLLDMPNYEIINLLFNSLKSNDITLLGILAGFFVVKKDDNNFLIVACSLFFIFCFSVSSQFVGAMYQYHIDEIAPYATKFEENEQKREKLKAELSKAVEGLKNSSAGEKGEYYNKARDINSRLIPLITGSDLIVNMDKYLSGKSFIKVYEIYQVFINILSYVFILSFLFLGAGFIHLIARSVKKENTLSDYRIIMSMVWFCVVFSIVLVIFLTVFK